VADRLLARRAAAGGIGPDADVEPLREAA